MKNEDQTPNSSMKVGGILTAIIVLMAIVIAVANPVEIWGNIKVLPLILGPITMAVGAYWQKDNNENGYLMATIFAAAFILTSASLWL